jgi:hypothetical protein
MAERRDDSVSYFLRGNFMPHAAHAVAVIRRFIVVAVFVLLGTFQASQASAVPIRLTGGEVFVDLISVGFNEATTSVHFVGPGFELTTDPRYDTIRFSTADATPDGFLSPGTVLEFSAGMVILSGLSPGTQNSLVYHGGSYSATGGFSVSTPAVTIGPLISIPFDLTGDLMVTDFMGTVFDLQLVGSGTVTAGYFQVPGPMESFYWKTLEIRYDITPPPIPEPGSLMLLGSGLLGLAARRRSARRA